MKGGERIPSRTIRARAAVGRAAAALCIAAVLLLRPAGSAEAGLVESIQEMYRLPNQVQTMQQQVDSAQRQLDEQKDKLAEAARQSKDAIDALASENLRLQEQNAALQSRIRTMEQAALEKETRSRQITTLVVTGLLLVIGYFAIGRLLRFLMWRRSDGSLRQSSGD